MSDQIGYHRTESYYVIAKDGTRGPRKKSAKQAIDAWKEQNPNESLVSCRLEKMTLETTTTVTNHPPF